MQIYLQHNKWTGAIEGINVPAGENCSLIENDKVNEMLQGNMQDYIVFDGELHKKDNIVRVPLEKKFTNIEYGKKATVKINIYPDESLIKVKINEYFLQELIDPFQFDNIQFVHPILKIFVHSKKRPELLGTLEIDLNDYIKYGEYKQDISTVLSKVNIEDLVFKTQRCFKKYAYEILENKTLESIDRNLIDKTHHLGIIFEKTVPYVGQDKVKNGIIIRNNIRYWQEFEHMLNDKIMISFVDKNNPAKLEHYISFTLKQLQEQESLSFDKPYNVILTNKNIYCNKKQLKIKYEDTSN